MELHSPSVIVTVFVMCGLYAAWRAEVSLRRWLFHRKIRKFKGHPGTLEALPTRHLFSIHGAAKGIECTNCGKLANSYAVYSNGDKKCRSCDSGNV